MADKEQLKNTNSDLTPAQKAAENSALDAAPVAQAKKEQREGSVTDSGAGELVEVGGGKRSAAAVDPTLVEEVGGSVALTPGTEVTIRLGERNVRATVYAVHPGTRENRDAGIPEIKPTMDVKARTGNPDTGGDEMLFGIPVGNVVADASFSR